MFIQQRDANAFLFLFINYNTQFFGKCLSMGHACMRRTFIRGICKWTWYINRYRVEWVLFHLELRASKQVAVAVRVSMAISCRNFVWISSAILFHVGLVPRSTYEVRKYTISGLIAKLVSHDLEAVDFFNIPRIKYKVRKFYNLFWNRHFSVQTILDGWKLF